MLFVTDAIEPPPNVDLSDAHSCPDEIYGIALGGVYYVAVVVGGQLVNEVPIPGNLLGSRTISLPLRNTRYANYRYWRQGDPIESISPGADIVEPTRLINLADFNADGHAWEFRLLQYGVCGHEETLLAGYSAKQRRAIVYPIILGKDVTYWHDNFFPAPGESISNPVHYDFQCFDHASELQDGEQFEYNDAMEAWVRTREDHHLCTGFGNRMNPTPTSVQVHVGSARGRPGETVTLAVTLDPGGAEATGVELHLPFGADFTVKRCVAAPASLLNDVRPSSWGIDAILMGLGCGDSPPPCGSPPDGTTLYRCDLEISQYADPGVYKLSPSGLLVSSGWDRLHATATDGEIIVDSDATPTPGR